MGSLDLKQFSVGTMDNNVYILVDPEMQDSVLFDALQTLHAFWMPCRGRI